MEVNSNQAWFQGRRLLGVLVGVLVATVSAPVLAQTTPPDDGTPTTPDAPAKPAAKKKKGVADQPAPAGAPDGSQPGGASGAPGAKPATGEPAAAPAAPSAPVALVPRGPGPWDHDLVLARIPPADPMTGPAMGLTAWVEASVFDRGGVACLARDGKGRLVAAYQWFPQINRAAFDRIAIRTSTDEGKTWSGPRTVTVTGLPTGATRPCDPTLVLLDDGRLRLYFTSQVAGARPMTYSAVSPAADGQTFEFEPGVRFGDTAHDVLDCAVAKLGDTWHYFAPIDGEDGKGRLRAYHAVSKDGLKFETQVNVTVDQPASNGKGARAARHHWLGCAATSSDGKSLRFFGSMEGAGGVWSARSINGADWKLEEVPFKAGMDPAVAELRDGGLLVIATGPARPGTPSAKRPGANGRP